MVYFLRPAPKVAPIPGIFQLAVGIQRDRNTAHWDSQTLKWAHDNGAELSWIQLISHPGIGTVRILYLLFMILVAVGISPFAA